MAITKKYDIAVKTGSYQDGQGQTKNRYMNIGAVMQGDNGPFILLDPMVNLAAAPREPGKDRVICSLFEPRAADGQAPAAAPRQAPAQRPAPQPQMDDSDIPF
jgi:hypothetical protein